MKKLPLLSVVALLLAGAAPAVAKEPLRPSDIAAAKQAQAKPKASVALPSSAEDAVRRLDAFFNGMARMTASFTQTAADGSKTTGSFVLERPGKFRFAYDAPSALEITSDGRNVFIRDSRLKTNDVYPLNQTPLKFLTKDRLDLLKDVAVTGVRIDPDGIVAVTFDDERTLGGTSSLEVLYDTKKDLLRQWAVKDPQGFVTIVTLGDVTVDPLSPTAP